MRLSLLLFSTLLTTTVIADVARPNFSGEWVMDLTKSDFGAAYPPSSFIRKIAHHEPDIEIIDEQVNGSPPLTRKMTTDGKVYWTDVIGRPVSASIVWEGRDIVATTVVDSYDLKFVDRMSVSSDGNILTSKTLMISPQGNTEITIVFERPK